MNCLINTDMGKIVVDSDVIAKCAGAAAIECIGVVGMATVSVKDGFSKLLRMENLAQGVEVKIQENNKLQIKLHIIVAYGVNIKTVADTLISTVKYKVKAFTGIDVVKINVKVEGVRYKDE